MTSFSVWRQSDNQVFMLLGVNWGRAELNSSMELGGYVPGILITHICLLHLFKTHQLGQDAAVYPSLTQHWLPWDKRYRPRQLNHLVNPGAFFPWSGCGTREPSEICSQSSPRDQQRSFLTSWSKPELQGMTCHSKELLHSNLTNGKGRWRMSRGRWLMESVWCVQK